MLHYNPQIPFFALLLHKCSHLTCNSAFDFASVDTEFFTCHEINQMKFKNDISPIDLIWNSLALTVISIPLRLLRPCISPPPHDEVHQPLLRQLIYQNICCSKPCSEPLMGKIVSEPKVHKKNQTNITTISASSCPLQIGQRKKFRWCFGTWKVFHPSTRKSFQT